MTIEQLHIYPVKGLKGISVQSSRLTQRGFEHDRRWMLIDDKNYFLSQRSHMVMATYHTSIDITTGAITIQSGDSIISITPNDVTREVIEVGMFEHVFPAHLAKSHINEWWSEQLDQNVRMVYLDQSDVRIKNYIGDGDKTEMSMADGYPYLILGTASHEFLNNKLDRPVSIDRFRANIIVNTNIPHEEDTWKYIHMGSEKMYLVKKCARCQVITIDQTTADKSTEPAKTLASYRKEGNKINFGVNAVACSFGIVSIGDSVSTV